MTKKTKTTINTDVAQLQDQLATLDANWKRALADYQNLVKRVEADKAEIMKLASLNVINKLLPSLDILELAASHSQDPGIIMAVKQFHQVLAEQGLEEIVPQVGDHFDPNLHECTETVAGDANDTIAEVVTKGYKINGFTLRPSRVKVYKTN